MRKLFVPLFVLFFALPTFGGTYERLMKLRDCDKIIIKQKRKDDVTIMSSEQVKALAKMFIMEIDTNNHQAGEPTFRLEFYRGNGKKPVDTIWVATNSNWGLKGVNGPLARNPKVLEWVRNALKR